MSTDRTTAHTSTPRPPVLSKASAEAVESIVRKHIASTPSAAPGGMTSDQAERLLDQLATANTHLAAIRQAQLIRHPIIGIGVSIVVGGILLVLFSVFAAPLLGALLPR